MPTALLESGAIWIEVGFLPDSEALFAHLVTSVAWDERMRTRKAASFGVPYNYSGIEWPAAPFPPILLPVLSRVAQRLGQQPNNCLAHYYPNGTATMGFHSDATEDLEPGTGIAVVSLGAGRTISFRSQRDKQRLEHYRLPGGSLLYMTPEMQRDWKHAILASATTDRGRISLTFRRMKAADGTVSQVAGE
jgi:alkylated DNA repair dioxygenase AlkB